MKIVKISVAFVVLLLLFSCQNPISPESPESILGYWYMPGGSRNWKSLDFKHYGEVKGSAYGGRQHGTYDYTYSAGVLTIYDNYPTNTTIGTATISGDTLTLSGFGSHWIEDGVYYLD